MIRPLSGYSNPAPQPPSKGPAPRAVIALVLAVLLALGGVAVGLIVASSANSEDAAPSMRLATPEEAAAATGAAPGPAVDSPPVDQAAPTTIPAVGDPSADGVEVPATGEPPSPDEVAAVGPDMAPLPEPLPVVPIEPFVIVAEALVPSVVLVEVEASEGLEFGLGSGIVWDAANGYIVTNQHVVAGATGVTVTLSDGTLLDGEVIGESVGHDIAVVQVDPGEAQLIQAEFAPADSVRVGQLVVAIGSPLGLTGTVTAGIVSAVRIQVQGGADPDWPVPVEMIQTDAAINRGNSGGALADSYGRVIGMNTLIHTTSGANIGLGFAVPSDTVELIASRIVKGESMQLGYLGISGQAAEGNQPGVMVFEVMPGSPAEAAGLQEGDVIITLDSQPMDDIFELSAAIKLRTPGEAIEMTVERDGDIYIASAVLAPLE